MEDALRTEYDREIRRCWDLIARLSSPFHGSAPGFRAERERTIWSLKRLGPLTDSRGVGVLVQRGAGAVATYSDNPTLQTERSELGPDWRDELDLLVDSAAAKPGEATRANMDAIPVWRKLLPDRGPALVVARPAADFSPLVAVVCYASQRRAPTAVAFRIIEREARELADFIRGHRLETQAAAAQDHVSNAVLAVQAILEEVSACFTQDRATAESDELDRLRSAAAELNQLRGTVDLLADWAGDLVRPLRPTDYSAVPVSDLISAAIHRVRPSLEAQGIEIERLLRAEATAYVRPSIFHEAIGRLVELARLHCQPTWLRIETRQWADVVDITLRWDGQPLEQDHIAPHKNPDQVVLSEWGDTTLLLQANDCIERLSGRMQVISGRHVGTVVNLELPRYTVPQRRQVGGRTNASG